MQPVATKQPPAALKPTRPLTSLSIARNSKVYKTTLAGKLWPALKKFLITPTIAMEIVKNIIAITDWQDLLVLSALAFGAKPLAKYTYQRQQESALSETSEEDDPDTPTTAFEKYKRFTASKLISQIALIALSVYGVDVACVILTTIGFTFPTKWDIPGAYSKTAYTYWFVKEFLIFKKLALCKVFKADPEDMGRTEILNRLIDGTVVALSSLLLFDWLSVRMGMAVKSLFAFGSVGTLAFTLASKDIISQLLSGFFLTLSNKLYVGDSVRFGDGTSGKVLKMGWLETVIRGSDETVTSIPNAQLYNQKFSNMSRLRQSQVQQTLRFSYADADVLPDVLASIKDEIEAACPKLIKGTRPFRVFWTGYDKDHLEVMVSFHLSIAPGSDAYYYSRQNALMAINRAVKKHGVDFYYKDGAPKEWRLTKAQA